MISVCDALNDSKCEATTIYDVVGTEVGNKDKIKKLSQKVIFFKSIVLILNSTYV